MFFKQVGRNSAKNRKGNSLFYGSLVIAIIAFYTLLSLGSQDVMHFLSALESDAIRKLMMLLPVVYVISLFFVFFLVYFACKYQTDNRKREFGMYLMLGMRFRRLFLMLFSETLWNSLIALLIGIPAALFLTEGISLTTAKLVGLGIIGHHFSFSFTATLWTVCGFIIVQLLSMFIICIQLAGTEPVDFLRSDASKKQVSMTKTKSMVFFVLGAILLITAYYLGIFWMRTFQITVVLGVFACGICGTFFFYRGLGSFLGRRIQKKHFNHTGLAAFTSRQIQENVLSQYRSLTVASLLILIALSCISYGISMGIARTSGSRSVDFSLFGEDSQIDHVLAEDTIHDMVKTSYPLYLSMIEPSYWENGENAIDLSKMAQTIATVKDSENLLQNLRLEYVISESSYNNLLNAIGKEEIHLEPNEAALYTSMNRDSVDFYSILEQVLEKDASVGINQTDYALLPILYYDNIVADRAITLYLALIVPDSLYEELAREDEAFCRNVHLTDDVTKEMGLMQAVQKMDALLSATGIEYDSFLAGIGRNLFYTVSASYLTIYLGILFLIISNTVIGLKFLIQQRQKKHRYVTLSMLGADTEEMCRSAGKQIQIFFSLALGVSLVNSIAAIISMYTSFTKLPIGTPFETVAALAAIAMLVFVITEIIYINVVKRTAAREIRQLPITGGR